MKTIILVCSLFLFQMAAKSQTDYIKIGDKSFIDYSPEWKTAILNSVVAIRDNKGQPLMLIITPAQFTGLPKPGIYNIVEGSKRKNKKNSGEIKIQAEPNWTSVDNGGTVTISEGNDSIFTFKGENIKVIDNKTKEEKTISFSVIFLIPPPTK
jgi:hypothetical protein